MSVERFQVRLTGGIVNGRDKTAVVEKLASLFGFENDRAEEFLKRKGSIKKCRSFDKAEKYRRTIESMGAECQIFALIPVAEDQTADESAIGPQDEFESRDQKLVNTYQCKKAGLLIVIVGILSIFASLLVSFSVPSEFGFISDLLNNMYLYYGYPFGCESPLDVNGREICLKGFHLSLKTKYFILGSLTIIAYGFSVFLGLIAPPSKVFRRLRIVSVGGDT